VLLERRSGTYRAKTSETQHNMRSGRPWTGEGVSEFETQNISSKSLETDVLFRGRPLPRARSSTFGWPPIGPDVFGGWPHIFKKIYFGVKTSNKSDPSWWSNKTFPVNNCLRPPWPYVRQADVIKLEIKLAPPPSPSRYKRHKLFLLWKKQQNSKIVIREWE